jgi:hypothetical protein
MQLSPLFIPIILRQIHPFFYNAMHCTTVFTLLQVKYSMVHTGISSAVHYSQHTTNAISFTYHNEAEMLVLS